MKLKCMLILVVSLFLVSCVQEQKQKEVLTGSVRDWSSPDKIDPFAVNIGDFLEKDLRDYMIEADKAYWSKDYKLAAQNYLYMLSHNVYDIISTYNLACTYALMNKPELSTKFLYRAVDLGYVDFNYLLKDTDFDGIKETPVFKAAIDSIGQMIKNLGEDVIIESRTLLKSRIAKPLAFFPDKEYTVVIGLHGHSSNQNQMVKIWKHFDIPEFVFVVPQATYSVPIGQANEFRWNVDEINPDVTLKSEDVSEKYIIDVIRYVKNNYKVKEIYLLGLHQGTSVAFDVALKNPHLIRGVVAFGTDYDISKINDKTFEKAKGLKFYIVNSPKDTYLDPERCAKIKNTLESKGFSLVYKEIDSEYSITRDALKQSEKWFLGK
jgi:phospholipase/carboxylesterase